MQSISNSRPQFPPSISAHPFFSGLPLLLRNPLVGRNVERCAAHVPEHHKACHSCGQNTQWFPNSYTSIFKTRWTTSDSNDVFGSRIGSKMPKQHSNESKVPLLFCLWLWVAWASCLHHLMVALEPQSIAPIYRGNTSGPFPTWTTAFLFFSLIFLFFSLLFFFHSLIFSCDHPCFSHSSSAFLQPSYIQKEKEWWQDFKVQKSSNKFV